MHSASAQLRIRQGRPALGALLLALLLAVLQAGVPFAHAMLHVAPSRTAPSAHPTHAHPAQAPGAAWDSSVADERPCPLCMADHLPALPETHSSATVLHVANTLTRVALARLLSSAPLDIFCRPPPLG